RDWIAHAFLGLIVGYGMDQIKEPWACRHPLGDFDPHNFCPHMQVKEDNAVHTVVFQNTRPTFKDCRALTRLEQALEELPVTEPFDLGAGQPRQVSIGATVAMRRRLRTEANS